MSRKKFHLGKILFIGDRIKEIRGELGQKEFGEILGVKAPAVSKYESGRIPDAITLKKIADCGGVTVEWLLHGETEEAQAPKFSLRTTEHAPEIYDARPTQLNVDYLIRANLLTRHFLKIRNLAFTDYQEAKLSAFIYEYLNECHADPGEVVINRLADLIQRQKQEN